MRSRYTARSRGSGRVIGGLVLSGFAFVLLLIGAVFTYVGTLDHRDYTGRAEATVVERDVDVDVDRDSRERRDRDEDVTVYVSYRAEGRDFAREPLNGLNPDDYREGDRLTVAYEPGAPGYAVTEESTEEGAYDVFGYIGIPLAVLGLVLAGAAVFVFRRPRPDTPAPGHAGPPQYPGQPPYGPPSGDPPQYPHPGPRQPPHR